ncbi:MAG: orotate phosphoribosyltransferase [Dehalococcoidales bacterium]|nr:orotate phosphoribosyltransferase [Dehalococcoidales bacterium]
MQKQELARSIYRISHLTGTFKLRSGQISNQYFDKYLFESDPRLLSAIAEEMAPLIPSGTQILAGLEMGGIPIATALSLKTGLPAVFVRKKAKEYGTCKFAEGIEVSNKKVCIIEDVVTTGGQIILSASDLRKIGAIVEDVMCVILRGKDSRSNLQKENLNLIALFTIEELEATVQSS